MERHPPYAAVLWSAPAQDTAAVGGIWRPAQDNQYRFDLGGSLSAFVGGNVQFNSRTNSTVGDPASSAIKKFATLEPGEGRRFRKFCKARRLQRSIVP